MADKDVLGAQGEDLAVEFLKAHGHRILDRNWRCNLGEIDIVTSHGGRTVVVEVKTRRSRSYGHPFEAITFAKLARLRRLAAAWCGQRDGPVQPVRIDVVSVIAPRDAPAIIEHLEGVFS
jgi:putative endonuclease